MKKITITIILMLSIQMIWSQCNELYISEIFYGEVNQSDNHKNFSVEILNPKDISVNLADYSLKFTAVGKPDHTISLTGNLSDKGKYVVTLATSEGALASISDMISGSFDYFDYEKIYFEKNGVVIDRFGKDNITASNYDNFDITSFLTDPNYLANLNLNLQSIEDLDMRRDPKKTSGDVTSTGIENNWYPYSTSNFNDVGEHQGVCAGDPVIGWASTNDVEQDESDGSQLEFDADVTGNLPFMTSISTSTSIIGMAINSPINQLDDLNVNHTNITSIGISNGGTITLDLGTIVDDNIPEYDENIYFVLNESFGVYLVDNSAKEFVFKIIDNDGTAINETDLKKEIKIYPIVFNDKINIEFENDVIIKYIHIINNYGQKVDFENQNNSILRFNSLPSAYYHIVINTNKGIISQKILKK